MQAYAKAIAGFCAPAVTVLVGATVDGSGISVHESLMALAASLVTSGAVFTVKNKRTSAA